MIYSIKNEDKFVNLDASVTAETSVKIDGEIVPVATRMMFGRFAFCHLFNAERVIFSRSGMLPKVCDAKSFTNVDINSLSNTLLQRVKYVDSRWALNENLNDVLTKKIVVTPTTSVRVTTYAPLNIFYNGTWHSEPRSSGITNNTGVYEYEIFYGIDKIRSANDNTQVVDVQNISCGDILEYTYKGACNSVIVNGIGEEDTADVRFYEKQNINVLAIEKTRHGEIKNPVKKLLIEYNGNIDFSDSSYFRLNGKEIILTALKIKYYAGEIVNTNLEFLKYE